MKFAEPLEDIDAELCNNRKGGPPRTLPRHSQSGEVWAGAEIKKQNGFIPQQRSI
jgi:hypothetical protein